MSEETPEKVTRRQRAAIAILMFVVKMLNPTGYPHQVNALSDEIANLLDDAA